MDTMLTTAEFKDYSRLQALSRVTETPADIEALKEEVITWVRAGRSPVTRMRRRDWSRSIKGAYSDSTGDTGRVVWGYLEGDD